MSVSLIQGIDYLSVTGTVSEFIELEDFLNLVCCQLEIKDELFLRMNEGRVIGEKYTSSFYSVRGLYGGFKVKNEEIKFTLQLQGGFCRELTDPLATLKLLSRFKFTRIDIAIDDYKRRISQTAISKLGELGHYKGLDTFRVIGSKGSQNDEDVKTCYFGKSLKKVRFYNAEFLHGIPADRWELELRGEYAETACRQLLKNNSLQDMGSFLAGAIDFIEPGENWYQARRYEFWQSFLDELGYAQLKGPENKPSLEKMLNWLNRQVAPSMSVLYFGLGPNSFRKFCKHLAEAKLENLEEHHLAWIKYLQRSKEEILL